MQSLSIIVIVSRFVNERQSGRLKDESDHWDLGPWRSFSDSDCVDMDNQDPGCDRPLNILFASPALHCIS